MPQQLRALGLSYNAEVIVNTLNIDKFYFSDSVLMLDDAVIHAMFLSTFNPKTPLFNNTMPLAALNDAYLNLENTKNLTYNTRLPLLSFQTRIKLTPTIYQPSGNCAVLFIKPKMINVRNSSIVFPSIKNYNLAGGAFGICFTFFYEKYDPQVHKLNEFDELIED